MRSARPPGGPAPYPCVAHEPEGSPPWPLAVVEVEQEGPRAGEARVRVMATGVCHGDWHVANGDWASPLPIVLGLVDLYLQGRLKIDELVSRRWRLDEINEGFEAMRGG